MLKIVLFILGNVSQVRSVAFFWQNVRMFKVFQMQADLDIGEKERFFYILP